MRKQNGKLGVRDCAVRLRKFARKSPERQQRRSKYKHNACMHARDMQALWLRVRSGLRARACIGVCISWNFRVYLFEFVFCMSCMCVFACGRVL